MKEIMKLARRGAWLLAATMVVAGCAKDEDTAPVNPNYNAETGEVNAQFAFNIATASQQNSDGTQTTRMTETNTQGKGKNFRGIQDTKLQVFTLGKEGSYVSSPTTEMATKSFDLGLVLSAGQINDDNASHRVLELSLPLGSNNLMFYGRAYKNSGETANDIGDVEYKVDDNPANTSFTLKSRLDGNVADFNDAETLIASILSRIITTALEVETVGQKRDLRYAFYWPIKNESDDVINLNTYEGDKTLLPADGTLITSGAHIGQTFYIGTKNWYEYGEAYKYYIETTKKTNPSATCPLIGLEENLGEVWYAFTNINESNVADTDGHHIIGVRAGSGPAIERAIQDMAAVVEKVMKATATGPEEEIAKLMAARIDRRINNYFQSGYTTNAKFKEVVDLVASYDYYTGKKLKAPSKITNVEDFPTKYGLPMGAAQLKYDATEHEFSYKSTELNLGLGGPGSTTDVSHIMYPAEILYFGNSPIRVSDDAHEPSQYPDGVTDWNTADKWTALNFTANAKVLSSTRSVAMTNDVRYGSALLQSTVRFDGFTSAPATLYDNRDGIHGETAKEIDATKSGLFKLTGILVGGQNNEMGWNYLRKDETDGAFTYVIYDKHDPITISPVGAGATAGAASDPNYTLVFDNYNSTLAADKQTPVYVALEFENTGAGDFYGATNLVRSGGTFYIVGKLDPAAADKKVTFPTDYPIPPYKIESGEVKTNEVQRVFIQDFVTKADFVIGPNSLKSAYVTVPDLRSSQISLGLSVDITWKNGLEFNNVILGK